MIGKRERVEPTDDWQQLQLRVQFPEQHAYELIRPVVLFDHTPAERARQTGTPERTLYRRAARFATEGMASLFGPAKVEKHRTLPEPIRRHIVALKAEHPAFTLREIARICQIRFDRRIRKEEIERRQPWQSLIEANFGVQSRMADWDFARATTWAELLAVHDQWVAKLNDQIHWAPRERDEDRRSPRDVLGWYNGRPVRSEDLHRLFYRTRFGRKLDKLGYLRFRHWPGAL